MNFKTTATKASKSMGILVGSLIFCSSCSKDSGPNVYAVARNELDSRQYQAALKDFSKLIRQKPDHATGFFYRAQCNQALGNFDAAVEDDTAALKLYKQHKTSFWGDYDHTDEALLSRAQCNNARAHYKDSIDDLNTHIGEEDKTRGHEEYVLFEAKRTHHVDRLILRAQNELALKDLDAALKDAKDAQQVMGRERDSQDWVEDNQLAVAKLLTEIYEAKSDKKNAATATAAYTKLSELRKKQESAR